MKVTSSTWNKRLVENLTQSNLIFKKRNFQKKILVFQKVPSSQCHSPCFRIQNFLLTSSCCHRTLFSLVISSYATLTYTNNICRRKPNCVGSRSFKGYTKKEYTRWQKSVYSYISVVVSEKKIGNSFLYKGFEPRRPCMGSAVVHSTSFG